MSSIGFQRWISKAGAIGRLFFGIWLLAVLLVLHGAIQPGHLSNSQEFVPNAGTMGGMGASERTDSPSLQPRASFGTILTEARSLAPGRKLSPDGDPPSAILPISAPLAVPPTIEQPWPASWDQPRPKAWHAFEARAPPSTA